MSTTQRSDVDLVLAWAEVARTSPTAWSAAMAELRKYADRVKDQCIMSPGNDILVHQGRAREAAGLCEMLATCVQSADQIAAKRASKPA